MKGWLLKSNCNKKKCATCIFREDGKQLELRPERLAEIKSYVGTAQASHICHTTNKTCYGGLEYVTTIFYRLGWIKEETVKCFLETARTFIQNKK